MADAIETDELERGIPTGDIEGQEDPAKAETPEGEEAEDEVHISFEGEEGSPPPSEKQDSSVIRTLREENRKKDAELKALRAQVQPQPQAIEVGPEPDLEDFDYDQTAFKAAHRKWLLDTAKADEAAADARKTAEARQKAWLDELAEVDTQASELGARDYDQAKADVMATFNEAQQAVLVLASQNKAKMIYALGKNPAKMAALAKIDNLVKFGAEVARMETKLTVTTQRKAPAPEQIVRGSAPLSAGVDKHLERLEAEANRSGDRTKVVAYKRELKAKARS